MMVMKQNNRIDYLMSRRNAQINRIMNIYNAKIEKELKKRRLR